MKIFLLSFYFVFSIFNPVFFLEKINQIKFNHKFHYLLFFWLLSIQILSYSLFPLRYPFFSDNLIFMIFSGLRFFIEWWICYYYLSLVFKMKKIEYETSDLKLLTLISFQSLLYILLIINIFDVKTYTLQIIYPSFIFFAIYIPVLTFLIKKYKISVLYSLIMIFGIILTRFIITIPFSGIRL